MNKFIFWKKFSHFLLIGLSAIVLLAGVQSGMVGDFTQKGPNFALAIGENCLDPDEPSCNEPGPSGGSVPIEAPAPAAPVTVTPAAPAPVAPIAPAAPQCTGTPREYNECISCNTSRHVTQNACGVYAITVASQNDSACASWCPAPAPAAPSNLTPAAPVQPTYGPLNPSASASCVGGSENIIANWSGNGAASYQATLAVNGSTIASACVGGATSYTFGGYPSRTDSNYIVTVFAYGSPNCGGTSVAANSYGVSRSCPAPQPPSAGPAAPVVNPPAQSQPPQALACPGPGQAGTQQVCGGQWAYDECFIAERFSDGTPARYSCRFSGNRNGCQGNISCAAPATTYTPPVNQCRSISCPPAPANYYYSGQITQTCDQSVSLTCGTLIAQVTGNPTCSIVASTQSGNSPLNVSFTGTGYASSGKSISTYSWDLDGNGSYGDANGQTASRVYNNSTSVNLQVSDSTGQIGYCSTTININPPSSTYSVSNPSQPQIAYQNVGVGQPVYVNTLPKTGLPLAAWAIGAFLPAGLGMGKFKKVKKELESDPNYLWENREYRRS